MIRRLDGEGYIPDLRLMLIVILQSRYEVLKAAAKVKASA